MARLLRLQKDRRLVETDETAENLIYRVFSLFDQGSCEYLAAEEVIEVKQIRHRYVFVLIFLLILLQAQSAYAPSAILRVGVYQNPPLSSMTTDGKPQGFVIDLLEDFAQEEDWSLQYFPASGMSA
jgi:hypothetical protein